ncbi:hypothetical protein BDN70DRAFT_877273 [Pholiota conissans]|uniref:Uncharacterized protein n=1 Tax=Pholiota conissans TaxID=109636 RepID=A0A9P5Z3B9_9AGAR|nr:hypothetical protein BDN70DRAFT_877273 [Pholiota conissans]
MAVTPTMVLTGCSMKENMSPLTPTTFSVQHHIENKFYISKQIRWAAVYEMYDFCKIRGLREVWGYMWASWYCPKMWDLWARSTTTYLSRLRTTMAVENFWRQLKHNYLHNIARPRLDHLIWIRVGRSRPLTTYQRAFKKATCANTLSKLSCHQIHGSFEKWFDVVLFLFIGTHASLQKACLFRTTLTSRRRRKENPSNIWGSLRRRRSNVLSRTHWYHMRSLISA